MFGGNNHNIQQYLAEEPLRKTSNMSAISIIHHVADITAIEGSSSKLPNVRPPPMATTEQTLTRMTRTIVAQLRICHSWIVGQFMKRIDQKARKHCHKCGQSPHDSHYLFDCPSKPTKQRVESLWNSSTETAKHLNMAIDETRKQQQRSLTKKLIRLFTDVVCRWSCWTTSTVESCFSTFRTAVVRLYEVQASPDISCCGRTRA